MSKQGSGIYVKLVMAGLGFMIQLIWDIWGFVIFNEQASKTIVDFNTKCDKNSSLYSLSR